MRKKRLSTSLNLTPAQLKEKRRLRWAAASNLIPGYGTVIAAGMGIANAVARKKERKRLREGRYGKHQMRIQI